MREFVVTLHGGMRYTVRAERVTRDGEYFVLVGPPTSVGADPLEGAIALFEQKQVAVVVVRDHLVSEEKGDPVDPHYDVSDQDSDIPF